MYGITIHWKSMGSNRKFCWKHLQWLNFGIHLLIVASDFGLTLTDVIKPENTGFYGICYFYESVSSEDNRRGISVVEFIIIKIL